MFRFIIFLFLDVVAFSGVLVATLPFVINNFGGSVLLITVAFGLFSFFQFFVSPFWGNLSDKIGRKPLLILNCIAELINMCTPLGVSSLPRYPILIFLLGWIGLMGAYFLRPLIMLQVTESLTDQKVILFFRIVPG